MRPAALMLAVLAGPPALAAQEWNAPSTRDLVARAIATRLRESDSAAYGYRARAHGVVTFLVEVGGPLGPVSRLLKADELEVDVRWTSRTGGSQAIVAWRDSTFFPTGIEYHRDHLGIVTDDFGSRIRIGEGDEVAEVPHPLGPDGPSHYDYRSRDTVFLATAGDRLTLVAIDVRPRDPGAALAIGTVFVEMGRAVLVRSQFTFTGAAYRDPDLEDITVRLERAAIDRRYWLPYRQEIEISRRSAVLDFPLRSVIRARWTIGDFEIDPGPMPTFTAPAGPGLRGPGGPARWSGPLAAAIDSGLTPADRQAVGEVRAQAGRLVGAALLAGLPRLRPSVDRASEVLRVNRVQGLAVGMGLAWRPGGGIQKVRLGLGFGTADRRVTGAVMAEHRLGTGVLTLEASREVSDVGDLPVASGVVASLSAQESGRDYGHYVLLERAGLAWSGAIDGTTRVTVAARREWSRSVETRATPARGSFEANPALGSPPSWMGRVTLGFDAGPRAEARATARLDLEAGVGDSTYGRILARGEVGRRLGPGDLAARGWVGLGSRSLPARRSFALGGRGTLVGEPFRAWGGRRAAWLFVEWLARVPGPAVPFGAFGRTAPEIAIGPFIAAGWARDSLPAAPWRPSPGLRPVVGVAIELLARSVRVEIGQALRGGRGPGVTIDVNRAWWPVL